MVFYMDLPFSPIGCISVKVWYKKTKQDCGLLFTRYCIKAQVLRQIAPQRSEC